jgi:hypothetical protein
MKADIKGENVVHRAYGSITLHNNVIGYGEYYKFTWIQKRTIYHVLELHIVNNLCSVIERLSVWSERSDSTLTNSCSSLESLHHLCIITWVIIMEGNVKCIYFIRLIDKLTTNAGYLFCFLRVIYLIFIK